MIKYLLSGIFISCVTFASLLWIFYQHYVGVFVDDAHEVFFVHERVEGVKDKSVSFFVSKEAWETLEILEFLQRYSFLLQADHKKNLDHLLHSHKEEILKIRDFGLAMQEEQIGAFLYEFCNGKEDCMPQKKDDGSFQLYEYDKTSELREEDGRILIDVIEEDE